MKRILLIMMVFGLFVAVACESKAEKDKEKEGASKACTSTPSPIAQASNPATFPNPVGAVYTASAQQGPTQGFAGYASKDLADAFAAYKTALSTGGYSVTKSEKDVADAEVSFSGNGTTGQVALKSACAGRTTIKIKIRPS